MLLWIAAALLAFYVKGLCGFANTLVFNSIMNFGDSAVNISPVELPLGFPTNIIMTWQGRRKLKASVFVSPTVMMLLGSAMGAFLLKNIDASSAIIFFGIVMLAALFLGVKSGKLIDETRVRRLVIVLLIISGLVLIVGKL